MEVALIVVKGVHKGRHVPVTRSTFLIGRGKHCQLRPVRQDVGREHCAIVLRDGHVFLRDYGSINGTILNHKDLVAGEVEVFDDDEFDVGPLQFKLAITLSEDEDNCFIVNELFTGQPSEEDPAADSTIQVSSPRLPKPAPILVDEAEKLC